MIKNNVIARKNDEANYLGLSAIVFQLSYSSGYSLLLRHKTNAQKLQRGIRFYPAARELLNLAQQ